MFVQVLLYILKGTKKKKAPASEARESNASFLHNIYIYVYI